MIVFTVSLTGMLYAPVVGFKSVHTLGLTRTISFSYSVLKHAYHVFASLPEGCGKKKGFQKARSQTQIPNEDKNGECHMTCRNGTPNRLHCAIKASVIPLA